MLSVSAVIPCYNRAATIADAVDSAFAQTRPPLEVLVVDDGSTDGSAEIAEQKGANVIRLPANRGNGAARNVGIRAASGDAIAWLDSDDVWDPEHLSTVAGLLDTYPDAAVASAAIHFGGERSGVWYGDVPEGSPTNVARAACHATAVPMITAVVRRDALLAIGGFNETERCAVDFDIWLRLACRYLFVASRRVTATYRWHPNQISANPERQWYATYIFRKRALDDAQRRGDTALAEQISEVFRRRWMTDLQAAWDADRIEWLRQLLALAPSVPGAPWSLRQKWALRANMPPSILRILRAVRSRDINSLLQHRSA